MLCSKKYSMTITNETVVLQEVLYLLIWDPAGGTGRWRGSRSKGAGDGMTVREEGDHGHCTKKNVKPTIFFLCGIIHPNPCCSVLSVAAASKPLL